MNSGAFGENFPYTNFHDLNMDWVIKVIKEFLDKYQHIEDLINSGITQITELTEEELANLQAKADELETLLNEWYDTHSVEIEHRLQEAVASLDGSIDDAIARLNASAEQKLAQTLASIPSDYSEVATVAQYAERGVSFLADNLFNRSRATDGYRIDGAGNPIASEGYYISGWIPVKPNSTYLKNSPAEDAYHRYILLDANGDYIAGSVSASNIINTNSNTAFIRISGMIDEKNNTIVFNTAKDDVAREELGFVKDNRNLFNSSTITIDRRLDAEGNEIVANGYFTSEWIRVVPGAAYSKNSPAEDNTHRFAFYDKDRNFISPVYPLNKINAPSNAEFMKICGATTEAPTTTVKIDSAMDWVARYLASPESGSVQQCGTLLGNTGIIRQYTSITGGVNTAINEFPYYIKKNTSILFEGYFSTFSGLKVGKGYAQYRGDWVEITPTEIIFYHYENNVENITKRVSHGLTITSFILVNFSIDDTFTITCKINTLNGEYSASLNTNGNVFAGSVFFIPLNNMENITISANSKELKKSIWVMGDSYLGYTADRPMRYLDNLGYSNFLTDSLAGMDSSDAYRELVRLIRISKPKYLVWYLGMNDTNEQYETYYNIVDEICTTYNITMILNKVPTTPIVNNETKNAFVLQTGKRYINSYRAVGANSAGSWYPDYLSPYDNVHPTELGAKALAFQMLLDVPELRQ